MSEYNDGYDDFLTEAGKDDRVGKHMAMVAKKTNGEWPSQNGEAPRSYTNIEFRLRSGSTIELRWTPPPDPAPSKEELKTMERGIAQGIVNSVTLRRQLYKHYGKQVDGLSEGDEVGLSIEPRKSKKDGKSYPRVVAFIPAEECVPEQKSDIPF